MEISTKKLVAIAVIVSFMTSAIGGFVFGLLGGVSANKFFPGLADNLIKTLEKIDKNIPIDVPAPGAAESMPVLGGSDESLAISAIKKANPAVVSIIITKDLPKIEQFNFNPFGNDPFFKQFFGEEFNVPQFRQQGTEKKEIGGGTGFIVSSDGYIVTNKHVVSDKKAEYTVLSNDEKKYPAKVLALDPTNDLAIIKIDQKNLPVLSLGDSDKLQIGQSVIAIGNSLGEFRNTASLGIISGLMRSITASGSGIGTEQLSNIIQTDAAINPGNSGGPLLNLKGEAVGVNVAMAQDAQSIGFAIPINDVKKIINDVKTKGRIITPWLGVRYMIVNSDLKEKNNLSVDYGALITRGSEPGELAVLPGSPADKAGLIENDIILEFNGVKVDGKNSLIALIGKCSVGDEIALKILRKGAEKQIKVKLEERKS